MLSILNNIYVLIKFSKSGLNNLPNKSSAVFDDWCDKESWPSSRGKSSSIFKDILLF